MYVPESPTLRELREAAAGCKGCHLWEGATQTVFGRAAAQAVIGRDFRVSRQRGELVDSLFAPYVTATIHPSAILRQRDDESRRAELDAFVDDLRKVVALLAA